MARHLRVARICKARFPELFFVGTGYSYLQEYVAHVAEHEVGAGHADFVGIGRMVLVYPRMPADALAGRKMERRLICRTFSDCTSGPRAGLVSGCYPLDPHYRDTQQARDLAEIKRKGIPAR